MAERIDNAYMRLFEIRLYHHYWLDNGITLFEQILEQDKSDRYLREYDIRSFLTLEPTAATAKRLTGLRGVIRNTALGCIVGVPSQDVISHDMPDITLDFVVTVRSADFFNYTALTLMPQHIYELYHKPTDRTYRYKENVAVLSNLTGTPHGTGPGKQFFLSSNTPEFAGDEQIEALVVSKGALLQLTRDQSKDNARELSSDVNKWPVFVHQGDVPAIVPPDGLEGAPARGIELTGDIPITVFALIRMSVAQIYANDFRYVDADGHVKTSNPVYLVHFKNRSTRWRYINKVTNVEESITSDTRPLTYFGIAAAMPKPSVGLVKKEKDTDGNTQIVSEIFI